MKTIVSLVSISAALLFSACVTKTATPVANQPTPAQVTAAIVGPLAQGIVPIVLEKNPELAPVIASVAIAIPEILGGADLSPAGITHALTAANESGHLGLSPEVVAIISGTLSAALLQYEQSYGVTIAINTDPNVQAIANAFAKGLRDGLAVWQAAHENPS